MPLHIVFIGEPGIGKGTQGVSLANKLGFAHISTGNLLKTHPLAMPFMTTGALVPDDTVMEVLDTRLQADDTKKGVIWDGFPRKVSQVALLDEVLAHLGLKLNLVIQFTMPRQKLLLRFSGRRVCTGAEQHPYHLEHNPPQVPGICDFDGSPLVQRPDDCEEVVLARLASFDTDTSRVIGIYQERGILQTVDAGLPIACVHEQLKMAMYATMPAIV